MFGDLDYDPSMAYTACSFEEQLAALGRAVEAGKVRRRSRPPLWLRLLLLSVASPVRMLRGRPVSPSGRVSAAGTMRGSVLRKAHPFGLESTNPERVAASLSCWSPQVRHIGLSNETPYGLMQFCRLGEDEPAGLVCGKSFSARLA